MLNHPSQFPQLKKLLTTCQATLGQTQQTLATWTEAITQRASQSINLSNHRQTATQIPIQSRRAGQWLLIAIPAIALLIWNWKLLLALAIGLATMALIYSLQTRDLQPWIAGLRHWLNGPHRLLLLCVPCGSIAMLGTYLGANLWDDSHNAWLVSCILLQGLGMILGLALLSTQVLNRESDRFDNNLDNALADLTAPNPLSRLVAVRQLNRLLDQRILSPEQTRIATQALQILLSQETESLVREATLRSLDPGLMAPEFSPSENQNSESSLDIL